LPACETATGAPARCRRTRHRLPPGSRRSHFPGTAIVYAAPAAPSAVCYDASHGAVAGTRRRRRVLGHSNFAPHHAIALALACGESPQPRKKCALRALRGVQNRKYRFLHQRRNFLRPSTASGKPSGPLA
jgi:hypothetical protein